MIQSLTPAGARRNSASRVLGIHDSVPDPTHGNYNYLQIWGWKLSDAATGTVSYRGSFGRLNFTIERP